MSTAQERFLDLILQWLQETQGHEVDRVVTAQAYGTDWAGDTEAGFHSEFNVYIEYVDARGHRRYEVTGDDLKSLWDFVIARAVG